MALCEERVIQGGRLVKTAHGLVSFAAAVWVGLAASGASAQDACQITVGGPPGSTMCYLGDPPLSDAVAFSADGTTVVLDIWSDEGGLTSPVAYRWVEGLGLERLGTIDGGFFSRVFDVSADGSVAVGWSNTTDGYEGGWRAFRWVSGVGMQNLGTLEGGEISYAWGVNSDGRVVVGESGTNNGTRAFRWVDGQGMEDLGVLQNYDYSVAYAVSADGEVVVGSSTGAGGDTAFRWVDGIGIESLGTLDAAVTYGSNARAVDADGSIVVGESWSSQENAVRAFRWVSGSGMESLGALDQSHWSYAFGVNSDGTVIVGESRANNSEGTRAFRWEEGIGMESLGTLSGGNYSTAVDVSPDGSMVFGLSDSSDGRRAFIWRATGGGMEDYENLVLSFPVLANDSAVALAQSQFALGEVMDQTVFAADGQMVMSARAGLLHTEQNPTHVGQRDTSLAALSFGYGVSDKVTLGASLGLHDTSLKNNAFDMDTGRNIALWGVYSAGGVARTGLQFGAAMGYGKSEGEIARGRLLTDVTLATGDSDVTTRAVEAGLGYGFERANGWRVTPSVTLAHFDTKRAGYAETGAAFNATYDAMDFSRTEVTLAVEGEVKLSEPGRLRIGGGIKQELDSEKPRLSGTTDLPALPTFDIEGDFVPNKTRPFVTAGYTHDFGDGASFDADIRIGRAVYGNSPDLGLGVGYGWKF